VNPVTSDDVFDLMDAFYTSAAVGAAMELGLFWLLRDRPMDAAGVGGALRIPLNRCRYWLQMLEKAGLLEQTPDGYAPSATAQTSILDAYSQDTWAFLAEQSRVRLPAVRDLSVHLREPGSTWKAQNITPPNYFDEMVESPANARRFTRMLYEIHVPLADELAAALDLKGVELLMDLGGGSGVVSFALLRRYPGLSVTVVDIENVCAAGREIAEENALADRITWHATEFVHGELPSGFDMALACDTGRYSEAVFRKVHASLKPGGRIAVADQLAPAEGVPHPARLDWAFLASMRDPDAPVTTTEKVRTRLTQAGFRILSERPLPRGKLDRWSGEWVLIEAHR
jgi:ubiquinone/menaquinone biosynthesis C-methylase UbiE